MSEETKQPMEEQVPEVEETAQAEAASEAEAEKKGKKKKEKGITFTREQVEQMELAVKQLDTVKDQFVRLTAEYDNYRKRTANEKLALYDDATAKAVKELLPVADSVRMALENLKDADPEIVKGIELISNQLDKSFEKLKVESYGKVGDDFDPNLHNAIGMVDNEELGSGKIAAVFQTGFKLGDKIIRHAMVQVTN